RTRCAEDDLLGARVALVAEHREHPEVRLVLRDLRGREPAAVRVLVEARARRDLRVHALEVEAPGADLRLRTGGRRGGRVAPDGGRLPCGGGRRGPRRGLRPTRGEEGSGCDQLLVGASLQVGRGRAYRGARALPSAPPPRQPPARTPPRIEIVVRAWGPGA